MRTNLIDEVDFRCPFCKKRGWMVETIKSIGFGGLMSLQYKADCSTCQGKWEYRGKMPACFIAKAPAKKKKEKSR